MHGSVATCNTFKGTYLIIKVTSVMDTTNQTESKAVTSRYRAGTQSIFYSTSILITTG